jgi:hypothetical protein
MHDDFASIGSSNLLTAYYGVTFVQYSSASVPKNFSYNIRVFIVFTAATNVSRPEI